MLEYINTTTKCIIICFILHYFQVNASCMKARNTASDQTLGLMSNSVLVFDPEDDSEQTAACVFVGRLSSPAKTHIMLIKFSSHLCSRCCSSPKWASFSRCLNTKQKAFVLRLSNSLQTNTRKCIISSFALTGTHLAPQRDIRTHQRKLLKCSTPG